MSSYFNVIPVYINSMNFINKDSIDINIPEVFISQGYVGNFLINSMSVLSSLSPIIFCYYMSKIYIKFKIKSKETYKKV